MPPVQLLSGLNWYEGGSSREPFALVPLGARDVPRGVASAATIVASQRATRALIFGPPGRREPCPLFGSST